MPELKVFALKKLDGIVDEFWPEISEAVEKMYVKIPEAIYYVESSDLINLFLYIF